MFTDSFPGRVIYHVRKELSEFDLTEQRWVIVSPGQLELNPDI